MVAFYNIHKKLFQIFVCVHTWKRSDLNHIGALIEMPPLYENLTAYENLKVRTTILGLTDKRIGEVCGQKEIKTLICLYGADKFVQDFKFAHL